MSSNFFKRLQAEHAQGSFAKFIRDSAASGELFEVLPQLEKLDQVQQDPRWHPEGDVWTHTLLVIESLPVNATFAMALSALFHDVGKLKTTVIREDGRITAYGHESVSRKIANEMLDILGADPELKREVLFLVFRHMIAHSKETNKKTLHRLIMEGGYELVDQLLWHGYADVKGGCGDFSNCIRLRELFESIKTCSNKHAAPQTVSRINRL